MEKNLPQDCYTPPPIPDIPIVKSSLRHQLGRDVEDPNFKWIEPERQIIKEGIAWSTYRETVPHLNGEHLGAYIGIDIRTDRLESLFLACIASPAYAFGRDMQFGDSIEIPPKEKKRDASWIAAYQHLKELALEWLSYARVYLYRSLLLTDADDRTVMGRVTWLESMKQSPSHYWYRSAPLTARLVANQCRWFTSSSSAQEEDVERVAPRLTSLVERGYLIKEATPEGETYRLADYPHVYNRDRWHTFRRWEDVQRDDARADLRFPI